MTHTYWQIGRQTKQTQNWMGGWTAGCTNGDTETKKDRQRQASRWTQIIRHSDWSSLQQQQSIKNPKLVLQTQLQRSFIAYLCHCKSFITALGQNKKLHRWGEISQSLKESAVRITLRSTENWQMVTVSLASQPSLLLQQIASLSLSELPHRDFAGSLDWL